MCKILTYLPLKRQFCTFYKVNNKLWNNCLKIDIQFAVCFHNSNNVSSVNKDFILKRTDQCICTMNDIHKEHSSAVFRGEVDRYQGVTIDSLAEPCDPNHFMDRLEASLKHWIEKKVRGVWFRVALDQADWVPVLAKNGFTFHHSQGQHVTMYRWLPETEICNIPPFAHTMVGVGAIVFNSDREILVVRERYFNIPHWKLPGGYVEPNEDIGDAAVREVFEETNVKTKFHSLVTLRHTHKGMFGCSDIYFIASLIPLSDKITKCDREIAACEWMKVEEFLEHPHVHDGNRFFVKKFLESQDTGVTIGCSKGLHPVLKKSQCVFSISSVEASSMGSTATSM